MKRSTILLAAATALVLPLTSALAQAGAPDDERHATFTTEIPDTPAGRLLEWFVQMTKQPSREAVAAELGDSFNDLPAPDPQVLVADFQRIQLTVDGLEPFRILEIDALELDALLRGVEKGEWWFVTIGASATPPHKLATLNLSPLVRTPGAESDWGDISWRFNQRDERVMSVVVEQLREDRARPVLRLDPDDRGAIAQVAGLFPMVLLAEEIAAGRIDLEEPVPLDGSLMSLGSGTLRSMQGGRVVTVADLLRLAATGDNTAVDQIIGLLGRGAVERLVVEIQGPESPNLPFLTTGEFFKLKLLDEEDPVYRRYVEAQSEEQRRAALVELLDKPLPTYEEADAIRSPSRVSEVEWHASAKEITQLLGRLADAIRADETGRVSELLNEISPINREMGVWSFVYRVTGGEPGVYSEAFLVKRVDGERFRFAFVIENPEREIDYAFFSKLPPLFMTHLGLED
jgi:hypothetical protein